MKQMEDRFNHWAKYDYVFLNEEVSVISLLKRRHSSLAGLHVASADASSQDFSEEFKRCVIRDHMP